MKATKLDKSTRKKIDKLIQSMIRQTMEYKQEYKPGIYGKARINNTIMWELKEKGYSEELINLAIAPVLDVLTK
ncbi:MAG: hypothetical protein RIB78_11430 [Gammaproteobacteria bacterium]